MKKIFYVLVLMFVLTFNVSAFSFKDCENIEFDSNNTFFKYEESLIREERVMCATNSTKDGEVNILALDTNRTSMLAIVIEGIGCEIVIPNENGYNITTFTGLEKGKTYEYYIVSMCGYGTIYFSEKDNFVF